MEYTNLKLDSRLNKETKQVSASLVDGAQAGLDLAAALDKARASAKALASTSNRVKRVLAGFDQINRLGEKKKSGSSRKKSSKKSSSSDKKKEELTLQEMEQDPFPQMQTLEVPEGNAIIEKWLGLTDMMTQLDALWQRLQAFWQTVLVPVGDWISQTLIPILGDYLGQAFGSVASWISNLSTQTQQSWQGIQLGATQIFGGIGQTFSGIGQKFADLVSGIMLGSGSIGSSTNAMGLQVGGTAGTLLTKLTGLQTGWNGVMANLKNSVSGMSGGVTGSLQSVIAYLQGGFSSGWSSGFNGLKTPVKGMVNSIIGFLNKMISGLGSALNGVINAANKLKFTVPDWVPGIGGKSYGFSMKNVSVPKIPYLAKGAVLPANQPFLAVVGDQKHGTNVEAPLATIQEAVAAVMAEHTAGNMAGHEATVAVLRQILEAVLGIEVGDAAIARAAQNYRLKSAVMRGGGF